jgi:ABC-type uncharacterized transport system ATPase subunit
MISVSNLRKTFDTIQALKGISFHIPQGECYGLLDPTAAAKQPISIAQLMNRMMEITIAGYG